MELASRVRLRSGNEMPVMGLGTWQLTQDTADAIAAALALGYPMIDTSGDYGTQPGIAEGIRRSGVKRSDFYLVTKVEETDDAYEATRRNLDELGLDHADLMLIHRPPSSGPGTQLWRGLMGAREEGLTRDIGVSNYPSALIDALADETGELPAVNQVEWSPFGHSSDLLRYVEDKGIVLQAYSPLTRTRRLDDETLREIADAHDKTSAQVLLRWNLQRGTVPLPKANRREHMEENIRIFDFSLSEEEMRTLDGLNTHYSSLGRLPYV